ncbi:MAG: formimidoylglutamase [Pseudodesulfovibrio sp.]|nr:formimidoylglutamase [Pseudodesulfovibrio sp.]
MISQTILDTLTAPEIPGASHDENDLLIRDIVKTDPESYEQATHVLIGCPQDTGVQRNHGRSGAAMAPNSIRQFFYKLKPPSDNGSIRLFDFGNITPHKNLSITHESLHNAVKLIVRDEKTAMVLGGGNDISFPDAKAVHDVHHNYVAINVDAHLDMRKSGVIHSGTPYRNLVDGQYLNPTNFHEIGIQPWANSTSYMEEALDMGVNIHTLGNIKAMGTDYFLDGIFANLKGLPLFAGLDMDSVRASDAPGVSAPSPMGFTACDILEFATRCQAYGKTSVFEITEVNPKVDLDDRTSRLAALTLYTFIYGKR